MNYNNQSSDVHEYQLCIQCVTLALHFSTANRQGKLFNSRMNLSSNFCSVHRFHGCVFDNTDVLAQTYNKTDQLSTWFSDINKLNKIELRNYFGTT